MTEGQTIPDEALARFDIMDVLAAHRSGYLPVGRHRGVDLRCRSASACSAQRVPI
ncbi:hypothetical protein ACMAUO_18875 [Gluconacetobacter sp. Hr-1-5]|uniref:hypothetical protein n=1 Tax=Gluconacetobacter sp. Hr-1-5 TaxID=3395370 RepID=UPI003B518BB7